MAPTVETSSSGSDQHRATSDAHRVTAAAAKTFKQVVSVKLDDTNYLQWKQQVEGVLRGTKMVKIVVSPQIPPVFLSDADRTADKENPAYTDWEEQDSLLCTWILSTISPSLLSRFVHLRHSWQVWDEIHTYCFTQMRTRSRQLRSELRSISKGSRKISEFISRVRELSEALMSIGDPVSHRDLIEIVLEALPEEFNATVASVNSKSEIVSLDDLESQLLTQEARNEKFKKAAVTEPASINLTQNVGADSDSQLQAQNSGFSDGNFTPTTQYNNNNQLSGGYSGGRGSSRGRGFRGGRFRGRGGRGNNFGRSNVQCQICYKFGHDASYCHYRLQPQYDAYGSGYGYGAPGGYGYGAPSNVWMQPRAPTSGGPFRPQFPAFPQSHGGQRPQVPQALLTGHSAESVHSNATGFNPVWYPDSGATHHVTPDAANLMDAVSLSGSDQVHLGNGQGLPITSVGSMSFHSSFQPHTTLKLNNLLLVPSITKNLVSVSQFAKDNNVFFEFHANECFVKCQVSSRILLKGSLGSDGLYQFHPYASSQPPVSNSAATLAYSINKNCPPTRHRTSAQSDTYQCNNVAYSATDRKNNSNSSLYSLWHSRLGHPHYDVLKSVMQLCNVPTPNKSFTEFCSSCCLGKTHRLPSASSTAVYATPLELIFCDLWGPAPIESSCGYSYFLTIVDAYSRFTWIYPLKLKSHTLTTFQTFKTMVELQLNHKIKAVQSDGGGEFRPFTKFLNEHGIIHRLTCPHTHHQNGSVERKHRHIVETGLTLLAHAKMPLSFWDHAFLTATYLINRMPTPTLNHKSPFFMLYLQFPDYKFLKCFGCSCFPFLRPYNTQKLDFHSKECIFLGYSPSHKGYKCLDLTGKIFISKDVVFNEHRFPYKELFPTQSCISELNNSPVLSTFLPTPATTISSSPSSYCPSSISHSSPILPTNPATSTTSPPPQHNTSPSPVGSSFSPNFSGTSHFRSDVVFNPTPITIVSPSDADTTPSLESSSIHSSPSPESSPPVAAPHRIHPQNTHSMATRGKRGVVQPRLQPRLLLTQFEPTGYKQALKDPQWYHAMQVEYDALQHNQTWTLVPLPPNREAIGCKWVFRLKENPDGTINKYKARLVAKGFHQKAGFDYTETFSPVVKPVTVRIILTLAVTNQWSLQQLDINNAFLNGYLTEEVYMVQPPGFEQTDPSLVCKLNKALYGLKQAPRAWFDRLKTALIKLGFQSSKCDPSLFTLHAHNQCTFILVYVDDIIITGSSDSLIKQLVQQLNSEFSLKDLGKLDYFLGIEVHHSNSGSLLLSQTKYIRDLLTKANMEKANSMASPMASSTKLSKFGSNQVADPTFFRSIVGGLQYVTITRPEISYSVNKVCQFLSAPLDDHWKAVKRILRYLQGTLNHGLLIKAAPLHAPLALTGFCDADWASDPDDRRSTSGACIYLGPNLVSWWAKKQTLVARSSAEAEYRSLAQASAEILWMQSLLHELKVPTKVPQIYCDNLSAVSLAHNPVLHSRTKHMELDIFFVREKVMNKSLLVSHVPAHDQWADILTKPLSTARFLHLRDKLRVGDTLSLKGEY